MWFKVDDAWWRSKKVRKLGRQPVTVLVSPQVLGAGLWSLAGDWSADNLTDGFVPWIVIEDWDPDRSIAKRLVTVGFWDEVEQDDEPGILFHDWPDWQPTKDTIVATRASNARRAALHRDPELVAAIRERDHNRCRYCGVLVNWSDRRSGVGGTYDHVDPRGGNTLPNTVVACRACNSTKGSRTPAEAGMRLLPPGTLPDGPDPGSGSGSGSTPGSEPDQNQTRSSDVTRTDSAQSSDQAKWVDEPTSPSEHGLEPFQNRSSYVTRSNQDPDPTRPDPTYKRENPSSSDTAAPRSDQEESIDDEDREDVEALCVRLRDLIVENGYKKPTITKDWRRQARLVLDRDRRELAKALKLIEWCQNDPFWMGNIHSMPKFREKYDQLAAKANYDWQQRNGRLSAVPDDDPVQTGKRRIDR